MPDDYTAADRRGAGLSVCIVAYKDLSLNTRVVRQARSLTQAGHRVTIIGFDVPDPRLIGDGGTTALVATGVPPTPAGLMNRLWLTGRVLPSAAGERRRADAAVAAGRSRGGIFGRGAVERLGDNSFDVVHAHFDKALIAASMVARRRGAKLVFDAVEVPFDTEQLPADPVARTLRLAEMRREIEIATRADGWMTVNDSLADIAVERFGIARPLVLRNYRNAGSWPSDGRLRRDLGLTQGTCVLLHLNTMRHGEGLETAIDALARLPANLHLVGLGPAPQRGFLDAMRHRAAERGVAHRFHIAPLQPPDAVPAYIAGADIGVIARQGKLQNMRLSLPNRLFEMIAAGLPVVATRLPEIARVVQEEGIGLLFEQFDSNGLAAAVATMLEPETLAGFRAAVERASGSLVWEREGARYVRFIEGVAEQRAPVTAARKSHRLSPVPARSG